jgi:hypothetical protein
MGQDAKAYLASPEAVDKKHCPELYAGFSPEATRRLANADSQKKRRLCVG